MKFFLPKACDSLVVVLEVEVETVVGHSELFQLASVFLRGSSCSFGAVEETREARHLHDLVLIGGRNILHVFGHKLGSHAVLGECQDFEREGDGRLAHLDHFAHSYHAGGFDVGSADGDASFLASIGGDGTRLEDTCCPQPFVYSYFLHSFFIEQDTVSCPLLLLSVVVLVHCSLHSCKAKALDNLDGLLAKLGHGFPLLGMKASQDELYLHATRVVVAQAEAQAIVDGRTQQFLDILQSVVPRVASFGFQAEGAEGKCHIVHDDEHTFRVDVLLLHPIAHSVAAQIHVGVRLEEDQFAVLHSHASDCSVAFGGERGVGFVCQCIDDLEANVVSCADIFGTNVP